MSTACRLAFLLGAAVGATIAWRHLGARRARAAELRARARLVELELEQLDRAAATAAAGRATAEA